MNDLQSRSLPWTVSGNYPCFAWWCLCCSGGSIWCNDGPLPPWFCLTCLSEAELIDLLCCPDSPAEYNNNCTTSSPLLVMIWTMEEERRVFCIGRRKSVCLLVWRLNLSKLVINLSYWMYLLVQIHWKSNSNVSICFSRGYSVDFEWMLQAWPAFDSVSWYWLSSWYLFRYWWSTLRGCTFIWCLLGWRVIDDRSLFYY